MQIDKKELEFSALLLRAIAHPLRMRILSFIDKNGSINVNKIYTSLGLEQSITSQHLRILRNAGLVFTERDGKFVKYSIAYDRIEAAGTAIGHFLNMDSKPITAQNAA
ncbi:MAG: metalloregulator ArsR/SmtB family transcription factor [Bacteroidota bacterium]